MLINNVSTDLREVIRRSENKPASLARELGITRQRMNDILHSKVINDSFIKVMEVCGYDVKIVFVPREDKMQTR